jgi:hypothetical protein
MAKDPENQVSETPQENEGPVKKTTRRQVLRRAAAVGAGVAAVSYVKPSLLPLGISAPHAQAQPGIATLEEPPPPPSSTARCSIQISNFTATPNHANNTISGGFTVTNTSGVTNCGPCDISFWQITVQTGNPPGGCGADLTTNKVGQKNNGNAANSGGSGTPISTSEVFACGEVKSYTYIVDYTGEDVAHVVTLNLDVEPSPQHPDIGAESPFKACATTPAAASTSLLKTS